jgi:exonuclease SbcC
MEIASLQIENFQAHKSTTIRPGPGGQLTVITGPSDSGKTAIIRALRWVYFNTPQGTDFIRVGAREATVVLTLVDGTRIIRDRSRGSKNAYEIILPNGEKQSFAGFGVNVPLEIQQLTGVMPVQIGDLELNLNLAEQLDGPFLGKSISAGARAKVLGKLAGTEEVDYAAKQLATDLHRRGQDEKRLAAEIAGLEEKIREFDYLPNMKARIEATEALVSRAKATAELRDKLAGYQERLYQCEDAISQARMIIWRWRGLEEAENILSGAEMTAARTDILCRLAFGLSAAENGIASSQGILQKWAGLEKAEAAMAKASEAAARKDVLLRLASRWAVATERILADQNALQRWSGLDEGAAAALRAAELYERYTQLGSLRQKLITVAKEIARAVLVLEGWKNIDAATSCIEAAETGLTCRKQIISLAAKLDCINKDIETARQQAVLHENRVAELEGAYFDALLAAGRCPTCGQEITNQQIAILKEAV